MAARRSRYRAHDWQGLGLDTATVMVGDADLSGAGEEQHRNANIGSPNVDPIAELRRIASGEE
jgi:hypothetical protein